MKKRIMMLAVLTIAILFVNCKVNDSAKSLVKEYLETVITRDANKIYDFCQEHLNKEQKYQINRESLKTYYEVDEVELEENESLKREIEERAKSGDLGEAESVGKQSMIDDIEEELLKERGEMAIKSYEILDNECVEDGDKATITVKVVFNNNQSAKQIFYLTKENGAWVLGKMKFEKD